MVLYDYHFSNRLHNTISKISTYTNTMIIFKSSPQHDYKILWRIDIRRQFSNRLQNTITKFPTYRYTKTIFKSSPQHNFNFQLHKYTATNFQIVFTTRLRNLQCTNIRRQFSNRLHRPTSISNCINIQQPIFKSSSQHDYEILWCIGIRWLFSNRFADHKNMILACFCIITTVFELLSENRITNIFFNFFFSIKEDEWKNKLHPC